MTIRIVGAILIFLGFGSFGFLASANHKREVTMIKGFLESLHTMENELQYHKTPLPHLCRYLASNAIGMVKEFYMRLSEKLQQLDHSDAHSCVTTVIGELNHMPDRIKNLFLTLGQSLGQFDVDGQIRSIQGVKEECYSLLSQLSQNQEQKLKSYRTLGLCAGAAVAILFI